MRRLDHDLNRFTIELEADTAGITEILEQSESVILSTIQICTISIGSPNNFVIYKHVPQVLTT